MSLTGVLSLLRQDPAVAAALEHVHARGELDVVTPSGARPPLLALLAGAHGQDDAAVQGARPLVVVTATGREADDLAAALACYLPHDDVAVLPAWETLPHERLSPRSDTVARRLAVMRRLAHPTPEHGPAGPVRVLVVPVRALMQPVVEGLGDLDPVQLAAGQQADLTEVAEQLVAAAYTRVDMVERRGEFAVRGGILDVFPPTEDHPLRIEFWGEEVEEIRWFAVADQRSLEIAEHGLWAPPCRELLLTPEVRERAAALIPQLPGATEMLDRMSQGIAVEGMESLSPALVDRMVPVLDLVPDESLLVLSDPERVRRRAHDLVSTTEEFLAAAWTSAAAGGSVPIDLSAASFMSLADLRAISARRALGWWTLSPFGQGPEEDDVEPGLETDGATLRMRARDVVAYHGDVERALDDVRGLQRAGWRLVLATEGPGPAKRMAEQLGAAETAARLVPDVRRRPRAASSTSSPRPSARASSTRSCASRSSRSRTSPVAPVRRRRTCAACRRGGATSSTRSRCARATTSSTSSTASAASSSSCSARSARARTRRRASTSSSSTRRRSAGTRATASSCRPTSSTS